MISKINILQICLFFLLLSGIQAQSVQYPDIVYLHNGSVLKCKIVDYKEDSEVKIEIQGGSILVYKMEEVKEIVRNNPIDPNASKRGGWNRAGQKEFHLYKKNSFFFVLNMNLIGGFKQTMAWWTGVVRTVPTIGMGFDFSMGKAINRHLMLGGGISWALMDNYFMASSHIPIYAEIRGDINKKPTSLYYSLGVGYNWALMQNVVTWTGFAMRDAKGGIFVNPAIGLRFSSREKTHFTLEFNYSIHTARFTYLGPNSELIGPTKNTFVRPTLSYGLLF